jgi:hypothetical protein
MKRLELDVLALISKEVHHHLEVGFVGYVSSHHVEVRTVKEDLPKELERLPLGDVIVGEYKCCKRCEKLVGS